MLLREATPTDAGAIARLHTDSWRRTYRGAFSDEYLDGDIDSERLAVWAERLTSPPDSQFTLLATKGDQLLGFACSFGAEDPTWGTLVDNLHVAPEGSGKGLGRRLLADSALWAEQHHPGGFYLWVLDQNAHARRFYEHVGAQNEGPEQIATPDGGEVTQLRYVWPTIDPLRTFASESG